jgi:dihydrofolate reductase
MARLVAFNNISLDGYFTDAHSELSWAHTQDPEFNAFVADNAKGGGALLLGRITYDMMASFWPTPMAAQMMPVVALGMNTMQKFVCSRTMRDATWQNTSVLGGDLVTEVRALKTTSPVDLAILGSGSLIAPLLAAGLIDELQVVMNPIVLGGGRTMFEGLAQPIPLTLTRSRTFTNGNVFACYTPRA